MNETHAIDFTRVFDIIPYQLKKFPQSRALNFFEDGQWIGVSIETIQKKANCISAWFLEQEFKKGDCIAVIPKMGSPDWMIVDLASQQAGLILVPVHPTSSPEEIEFILKETSAVICIALDQALLNKVQSITENLPSLKIAFHLERGKAGYFHPLHLEDSDGKKSFNFDKVYLEKKTAEIFGKKILFQFEDQPQNSSGTNEKRYNSDSKGVKREDDPLIDLIISELGGEEISG